MKKLILLLPFVIISSCVKKVIDPLGTGCVGGAAKFSETYLAFIGDPTNMKKCEVFLDATRTYLKNCGVLTAAERKDLEKDISSTDCKNL